MKTVLVYYDSTEAYKHEIKIDDMISSSTGETYFPVCWTESGNVYWGFLYNGNAETNHYVDALPFQVDHSSYRVSTGALYRQSIYTTYSGQNASAYRIVYNSVAGGSIVAPQGNRTGGTSGNQINGIPIGTNKNWSYADYFLGDVSDADFWQNVYNLLHPEPPVPPYKEDYSQEGGGNGVWTDDGTDTIEEVDETNLNVNTIGKTLFATTYRLSFNALKGIASVLWSTSFLDWVKQYFANPMEGIINLSMLPVDYTSQQYYNVIIGNYDTHQVGNIVENQFKKVDCGYIDIPEKWGGAIDYKSRITLYLPFIGSHELDVAEVMGSRLSVSYIVDIVTGSCVAFVKIKRGDLESVLYQFNGNCAYSMPVTQNSYNSLLSSMLSATATVAVGVATGGASTPMMVGAGASVASDARPHVGHTGNLSGNVGYMSIKKPYVILTRPQQALPENFGAYRGYQSHITKTLSDCTGFTKVEDIHLEGITATADELAEIERLLKEGVII